MSLPAFEEILEDPRATPTEVVRVAAGHLRDLLAAKLTAKREFLEDDLGRLVRLRGAFGGVLNLVNGLLLALETGGVEQASSWLASFMADLERSRAALARLGVALIPPGARVVTHSRSTTIETLLETAAGAGIAPRVTLAAGLPLGEGRAMASRLGRAGLRVEMVADGVLPAQLAGVDLMLLGGAAMTPQGMVARAGSLALLRAARQSRVLAYAVMGSETILGGALAGDLRRGRCPAVPLWDGAPAGVTVRSAALELSPLGLLSGVLTEAGAVDAGALVAGCAVVPRATSFPTVEPVEPG